MISVPAPPGTYVTYALFQLSAYIRDNIIPLSLKTPKGFISRARTCVGQKDVYVNEYIGGDGGRTIMGETSGNNSQKPGVFAITHAKCWGFCP